MSRDEQSPFKQSGSGHCQGKVAAGVQFVVHWRDAIEQARAKSSPTRGLLQAGSQNLRQRCRPSRPLGRLTQKLVHLRCYFVAVMHVHQQIQCGFQVAAVACDKVTVRVNLLIRFEDVRNRPHAVDHVARSEALGASEFFLLLRDHLEVFELFGWHAPACGRPAKACSMR